MSTPRYDFPEPDASLAELSASIVLIVNQVEGLLGRWAKARTSTPPSSADEGDVFIIGNSPTGLWAGHAKEVTRWRGNGWIFYSPRPGWGFRVENEADVEYVWRSDPVLDWIAISGSGIPSLSADMAPSLSAPLDAQFHSIRSAVIDWAPVSGSSFILSSYADYSGNGLRMDNENVAVSEVVCTLDTFAFAPGTNFVICTPNSKRLRLVPASGVTMLSSVSAATRVSANGLAALALNKITVGSGGVPTSIRWSLSGDIEA